MQCLLAQCTKYHQRAIMGNVWYKVGLPMVELCYMGFFAQNQITKSRNKRNTEQSHTFKLRY